MAETARRAVRLRIEGRVQGVGFRAWVERNAVSLGLDGWVRNRRDGGVEASLAGAPDVIEEMLARCRSGPRSASVAMVKVLEEQEDVQPGFVVRETA